jgi:hypothetical protein
MSSSLNTVEKTLIPILASHLSHLDMDELLFRHNAILGGLAGLATNPIGLGVTKGANNKRSKDFLINWIIASLKGQATK